MQPQTVIRIEKNNKMVKLFLLKPDFKDSNADNEGLNYYCPQCAMIEGIIQYYPQLKKMVEIHRIDFKRPRKEIIDLLGIENQSCPVLILDKTEANGTDINYFTSTGDKFFVNSIELITLYLAEIFGIGHLH